MDRQTKEDFAGKFIKHPVLFMLVHTMLFTLWLRIVLICGVLFGLGFALVLPRIWRVSPSGVKPPVKISGLDYFQSKSLARSAKKRVESGDLDNAVIAWRSALVNNPGDLATLREFLLGMRERVEPPKYQAIVLPEAVWLLHLTQTNDIDLELAGSIFAKYGVNHHLISLLSPRKDRLNEPLSKLYLKTVLLDDRIVEFSSFWKQSKWSANWLNDPEMSIFWAAYEAGWGDPEAKAAARAKLESRLEDPKMRVEASRLYLKVCARLLEPDPYLSTLERLQAWQKDTVRDHVRWWLLLSTIGRKSEAVKYASDFPSRPMSALETLLLVEAYNSLGLQDTAMKTLDRFTLEFSFVDELWATYGNLLVEAKRWEQLRKLALKIRLNPEVGERLGALSYYLEGRAELGENRPQTAEESFGKIPKLKIENSGLALSLAQNLRRLNYPVAARETLLPHQKALENSPEYWELLGHIAHDLKDEDLLVTSMAKTFQMMPNDLGVMNNYAAALLVARQKPEEAVKYTYELTRNIPDRPGVVLNYATALIQNRRFDEAETQMKKLAPASMTDSERSGYDFTRFELLIGLKRYNEAKVIQKQISTNDFFAGELKCWNELVLQIDNS